MIATERYISLTFAAGGRERPLVDCWGLYRLIVGEATGIWLQEFEGTETLRAAARVARREQANSAGWLPVVPGAERALDAVLLRSLVGSGARLAAAPVHIGCVVAPGRMIDIEEKGRVRVRAFRTTARASARPELANRVVGIFRPVALLGRAA